MRPGLFALAAISGFSALASPAHAQSAVLVYRLGADTVAIEQYRRSGNRLSGETVQRAGPVVVLMRYDVTIGSDGAPAAATFHRSNPNGSPLPNVPPELRFRFTRDSIVRDAIWPDSTSRRAFAARGGMIFLPTYVFGPMELLAAMRAAGRPVDSIPSLGAGAAAGFIGFVPLGGDSVRLRGGPYDMIFRFDAANRLQSVNGTHTTNGVIATREERSIDLAELARRMRPTGLLSARDVARVGFGSGALMVIDYSRPTVRDRSVWGALVPYDSVWRAGANDATHLFTTRPLSFGELTVPPGMYTLWVQHRRDGTFLIVNSQTGQWGTQHDPAHDLGRVPMRMAPAPSHVEAFTITLSSAGANRGTLEMAWGNSVVSVPFTVLPLR